MKAFGKLLLSDLRQFLRDKTALFFTIAFPIIFIFLFGWIFSGSGDINYGIGLINNDDSPVGEGISQMLGEIPIFEMSQGELDAKLDELRNGDIRAVIVIPAGLEESIAAGQTADIKLYYDPTQTTSTQIILPVLRQAIDEVNRQLTQQPLLLQLSEESIQAYGLRDIDYLVPGILAMSVLYLGLFGSLTLVERREKKVLKRFGATPLPRSTMVFSQVIYRMILALVQTFIIIIIARLVFDVQMVGNWFILIGLVLLGTLAFIAIGYFAVSRAQTVEGAMPIIQIAQFPMLFLSGIFFPIDFMPDFMQPVIAVIPLTYLGDAFRQVMVEATPLYPLWLDVTVIGVWFVVCMLLAIRLFRWE